MNNTNTRTANGALKTNPIHNYIIDVVHAIIESVKDEYNQVNLISLGVRLVIAKNAAKKSSARTRRLNKRVKALEKEYADLVSKGVVVDEEDSSSK